MATSLRSGPAASIPQATLFLGGRERPRRLRDLLEEYVDAVPAGGEILWVTYYFRDARLADALARAHRRGVSVKLTLEGRPRLESANDAIIQRLQSEQDGIGSGLRVIRPLFAHLHEKLYCFSHPRPVALVGSFNPSGDEVEDPQVLRKIGDQDRGRNLLVELAGPEVEFLMQHARWMHGHRYGPFTRYLADFKRTMESDEFSVYLFPRLRNPLDSLMHDLPRGSRLRIAVSHLRNETVASRLIVMAGKGVRIEIIAEATHRRVPPRIEKRLLAGGVDFRRALATLPMHDKFLIADGPWGCWSAFGSYNLTKTSRWSNHEILIVIKGPTLFECFSKRWETLAEEACNPMTPAPPA